MAYIGLDFHGLRADINRYNFGYQFSVVGFRIKVNRFSVISFFKNRKLKTGKPISENRKPRTDNGKIRKNPLEIRINPEINKLNMSSVKDKLQKEEAMNLSTRFPHISRFISARRQQAVNFSLKFLVFVVIFGFFLINVGEGLTTLPKDRSSDLSLREKLLIDSNNPENYRLLAAEFLKNHDFRAAAYFNFLGQSINADVVDNNNFLSLLSPVYAAPNPAPNISLLKQQDMIYYKLYEREFLEKEIPVWKNIINYYPDYRDAYARLMWLNLKLGKTDEAKKYLDIVKQINPNWEPLEEIKL